MLEFLWFVGCFYLAIGFVLAFGTAIVMLDEGQNPELWMILLTVLVWLPAIIDKRYMDEYGDE